jgi:hypothetical protein
LANHLVCSRVRLTRSSICASSRRIVSLSML